MWIEQKVYTFKSEKSGDIKSEDILDNIFLRVNENLTTVTLKQLFLKNSEPELEDNLLTVKGYSILQDVVPITGEIKIKDSTPIEIGVKISFNSEILGDLEIIEIENPLVQMSDKNIEDSDVEKFNEKIIELSQLKVVDEKVEENEIPHSETSTETEPIVEPIVEIPAIVNKKYENGKIRYLNNGYKEFTSANGGGNFKLLIKKDSDKTSVILFEIVSEDEIKQFSDYELIDENTFEFSNQETEEKIKVSIADDKLLIEFVIESEGK